MPGSRRQPSTAGQAHPAARVAESLLEARFTACADRLKLIRSSVYAAAQMCGFAEETAQHIVLAVDEACQNIIVHGYGRRADGVIILGLFRDPAGILVQLRDFAPPVDPATIKPRDLADIKPGKLGSHFMHEVMDLVQFHQVRGGGNLLEMRKETGKAA